MAMVPNLLRPALPLAFLAFVACGHTDCDPPPPPLEPNPASILIEVYDPATNLVLPGVRVRVIEAYQEWAGLYYTSPYQDAFPTDVDGLVFLDEYLLAWQDVGFREDAIGRALLYPDYREDQAFVLVELDVDGAPPVFYELEVRWDDPDVFYSLPFP